MTVYSLSSAYPGEEPYLRPDNPRLLELRERYRKCGVPAHTLWTEEFVNTEIDLQKFRADNAYVYQSRDVVGDLTARYERAARLTRLADRLGLWSRCQEDG